ncbi:MAG: hypothetical protein J7M38_07375 [Armatimonadetes bacterium]|nr:hypothetical protein [Armatimonadota bacterium]
MDWRDNAASAVDVSFLLDKPAGAGGFITVKDGHLAKPDGERFRIWGVNTSMAASTPDKESAPIYAAHLARFGINCIRIHHLDWPTPRGIIDASQPDSRHFDAGKLDRLDFFIAELKKRGIYVDLNLNVGRQFREGDGVQEADQLGFAKAVTYFDPRLVELQKEYARKLLTHRNPYTGNEYRHEPAVAIVEMLNENSVVESWARGRLLGRQLRPTRATWTDIPPSYEKELTRLYNEWLRRRHPYELRSLRATAGVGPQAPVPRLAPKDFPAADAERFEIEARFYMHLEDSFFQMMKHYLREELVVKSLLIGTSAHNAGLTPYPLLSSAAKLDIVDGHVYWQHPSYRRDPATGKTIAWSIPNTAMVNDPLHSTVVTLSRNAVAGKPYTVSETNHPWPAEHAAEGIPILAAYAAFQDWDGVFWYTFEHAEPADWAPSPPGFFNLRQDPVKMTQLAAGALLFLRGDVAPARQTIQRSYTPEGVIESLRMPRGEAPYFTPGFPLILPLEHGSRIASFDGIPTDFLPAEADPVRSDTGELTWYHPPDQHGVVTVDSPRAQALVGFLKASRRETTNLAADVANDFCAIMLGSLEDQPIARASRLLLTTGARVATTGMKWNEQRTTLVDQGRAPVRIETVAGTITLKGLDPATSVSVAALDSGGKAMSGFSEATPSGGDWSFPVGRKATPWYLILVKRQPG